MGAKHLSVSEREEIAIGLERGDSRAEIARNLGRHRSTVGREIARNTSPSPRAYRAFPAHIQAGARARRPKPHKLVAGRLRAAVVDLLAQDYSPQQAAGRLKRDHPERPEMHVCHETIYQALYVQGRNNLRAELKQALAQGRVRCPQRVRRRARTRAPARPRFDAMVNISQRPAEAQDRAVPGHWEGDLVIGKDGASAIATLAERTSRFTLLIALGGDRTAPTVAAALAEHARRLPDQLRRSLAWDQGIEMAAHADFTLATDIPVYFCDPHSPWQRGTNENTNRLVRYYFPKGVTDFSRVSQEELDAVARRLNTRPRKTLDYRTPAEALDEHLVATTT